MKRNLTRAQRRRLLDDIPEIPEGPHPDDTLILFAGWSALQIKHQAAFGYFDRLPRRVRMALWQLAVTFDPIPIGQWYDEDPAHRTPEAVDFIVHELAAAEHADLQAFAKRYRRRYGCVLPHLAARATVLRYGAVARSEPLNA